MIDVAYDRAAVALVALAYGDTADDELRAFGKALLELDGEAVSRKITPVSILIVIVDGKPPTADQRRLVADLWKPMKAPLHVFALVSTSPIARGIMKVVQWLNPPGASRHDSVQASFREAVLWAERERGAPIPALSPLHAQVMRGAPAATRSKAG